MLIKESFKMNRSNSFDFFKQQLSTEVISVEVASKLLDKVLQVKNNIIESLNKIYNKGDYIPYIKINNRKLQKKINAINYTDLTAVKVFKPIGLIFPYNVLIEAIEVIQEDLLKIEERVLTPFLKWSGEVLNRPEKLSRITINQQIIFLDTSSYNAKIDNLFNPDDTSDVESFGNLFTNNENLIEVISTFNHMIKLQNNLKPSMLLKKINNVTERAEVLVRRCKVSPDDAICSVASKKVIADVLYDIGTELTLYSRLSYLIYSSKTALEDSANKIIKFN